MTELIFNFKKSSNFKGLINDYNTKDNKLQFYTSIVEFPPKEKKYSNGTSWVFIGKYPKKRRDELLQYRRFKDIDVWINSVGMVHSSAGRIVVQKVDSFGVYIYLYRLGKRYKVYIKDLVYRLYHPEHDGSTPVYHKDGDIFNNCIDNLTYAL